MNLSADRQEGQSMKGLMVTPNEQGRIQVLNQVIGGRLRVREAALLMGVRERQACLSADRGGDCWRRIVGKAWPP